MDLAPKLCAIILQTIIVLCLTSCRAMDTHDIDGTNFQNEKRRFYAPEKEADVKLISHAYRWVSGDLRGSCSHISSDMLANSLPSIRSISDYPRYPVDTIFLETAGLFPSDSSDFTVEGSMLLSEAIQRLSAYTDILYLTVEGHTDDRGSNHYNNSLSYKRAKRVAVSLQSALPGLKVQVLASGEKRLLNKGSDPTDLAANRRVSIKAIVSQQSDTTAAKQNIATATNTLCQTEAKLRKKVNSDTAVKRLHHRIKQSLDPVFTERPPLSAGDRIRLHITQGEDISGIYEVGIGGQLEIPYLGLIQVQGLNTRALESILHDRLIEEEIFRSDMLRVSTSVQEWAPIDVLVSGATFDPGRVTINRQKAEVRTFKQGHVSGDFAKERFLSSALFSAGGIRPDADLKNVQLIRNGNLRTVDMSGLFLGQLTRDIPLAAGDQVVVPSLGYFQAELVRRTQVTPPGIRIFISNLSIPAQNNSQSAINSNSTSMPYGTRFLQGLVTSNCVGGTQLTNASRRAVLISTNPMNGRTEVIERSIQQLISDPERDEINPFLMPNDGIACYDSGVTNFRDVTKALSEFISPFLLLRGF